MFCRPFNKTIVENFEESGINQIAFIFAKSLRITFYAHNIIFHIEKCNDSRKGFHLWKIFLHGGNNRW